MIQHCENCGSLTISYFNGFNIISKCLNCDSEFTTYLTSKEEIQNLQKGEDIKKHIENFSFDDKIPILINKLRKFRIDYSLSQRDISKRLGITAQRYGALERCDTIPTLTALAPFCVLLDADISDLYSIITLTKSQFNKLRLLTYENEKLVIDTHIEKLETEIKKYETENNISERRLYSSGVKKDTPKTIAQKEHLKELDRELKEYKKKTRTILVQDAVIEYSDFEKAKKLIGYID